MEPLSAQSIRILDFDSSIVGQKNLLAKYNRPPYSTQIVDLLSYGPLARAWISNSNAMSLSKEISPSDRNKITLYGSGDFHHISALLMDKFDPFDCASLDATRDGSPQGQSRVVRQAHDTSNDEARRGIEEDFCVIIFDLHPDLDTTFPKFSCGSWVNLAARKKNVKKIVMIGPSSEDLNFPHNMTFNFSYFKNGRIELYPFYHKPSITAFGRIVWNNLRDKDIKQFMAGAIDGLPSKNVYISIDKDCLKRDYAVTNWEEGPVALDWLLEALKALKDKANVIGMDITGDYSPVKTDSVIKKICAALDHPRQAARGMSAEKINKINEDTNMKILELFLGQAT